MSNYSSYKIYKMASTKSILDVLDALNYHKENKNKELVYKGSVIFVINEYGGSKIQERAFLSKSSAKLLSYSILNHHFPKIYEGKPFQEFGGSVNGSIVRSRIFSVHYNPNMNYPYRFQIDEGPGYVGDKGQITMKKKPDGKLQIEKTVHILASYDEALKMSHEIYNYIQQSELIALSKGRPYVTILPGKVENPTNEQQAPNEDSYSPDVVNSSDENNVAVQEEYVITIGNWAGRKISELDTTTLEMVIAKLSPDNDERREFIEAAKIELANR